MRSRHFHLALRCRTSPIVNGSAAQQMLRRTDRGARVRNYAAETSLRSLPIPLIGSLDQPKGSVRVAHRAVEGDGSESRGSCRGHEVTGLPLPQSTEKTRHAQGQHRQERTWTPSPGRRPTTGCLLVLGAGPMLGRLPNVSSSTWGWYAIPSLLLLLLCPTRGLRAGAECRGSSCRRYSGIRIGCNGGATRDDLACRCRREVEGTDHRYGRGHPGGDRARRH